MPTIICVRHSGTGTLSGDHCGFYLLMGYNLVLRARATFLMYPCGSSLFKCVCNLVGMIFLGLIISFSHGSIFLRQYKSPSLVVRERHVSLFTLGVDVSFLLYFLFLVFLCRMWGVGIRFGVYAMWRVRHMLSVSSCSCSVFSWCFGSVLVIVRFHHVRFLWG